MERTTFEPFQNLLYYRRCVIMLMRMFLLKNENVRSLEKFLNVGRWFDVSNIVTFIKEHFSIRPYSIIFLFSFFEISWFVPSSKSNSFYASRESLIFPPIVLFFFPVLFEIVFTDKLSLSLEEEEWFGRKFARCVEKFDFHKEGVRSMVENLIRESSKRS